MFNVWRERVAYLNNEVATGVRGPLEFDGGGYVGRVVIRSNAQEVDSGGVEAAVLISGLLDRSVLRIANVGWNVIGTVGYQVRFDVFCYFERVFSAGRFLYLT